MGKASRMKRERQGMHLALPSFIQGDITIRRHHEDAKISGSLGDLIDPYIIDDMTPEEFRKMVMVGVLAWNLSTFDETRRTEELGRFIELIGDANVGDDLKAVIRDLVARKLTLFPDDYRVIVAWDVKQNKNHFHITAAAVVPNGDSRKQKNPEHQNALSV